MGSLSHDRSTQSDKDKNMSSIFMNALAGELSKQASRAPAAEAVKKVMRMRHAKGGAGLIERANLRKSAEDMFSAPKPPKAPGNSGASNAQTMESKPKVKRPQPLTPGPSGGAGDKAIKMPSTGGQQIKMSSAEADDLVSAMFENAEGDEGPYTDEEQYGVYDPRFGGGKGLKNLGGKRAPKFTKKVNPTDMPGAFKAAMEKCSKCRGKGCPACEAKMGAGCGPKYGCGGGKHGTGCGLRKAAGAALKKVAEGFWGPKEEVQLGPRISYRTGKPEAAPAPAAPKAPKSVVTVGKATYLGKGNMSGSGQRALSQGSSARAGQRAMGQANAMDKIRGSLQNSKNMLARVGSRFGGQ